MALYSISVLEEPTPRPHSLPQRRHRAWHSTARTHIRARRLPLPVCENHSNERESCDREGGARGSVDRAPRIPAVRLLVRDLDPETRWRCRVEEVRLAVEAPAVAAIGPAFMEARHDEVGARVRRATEKKRRGGAGREGSNSSRKESAAGAGKPPRGGGAHQSSSAFAGVVMRQPCIAGVSASWPPDHAHMLGLSHDGSPAGFGSLSFLMQRMGSVDEHDVSPWIALQSSPR